jgi:EmrB/QacA subfamily drug resistance transporter
MIFQTWRALLSMILKEKKWHILIALALGTIMVPINTSIVNVALPFISTGFNTNLMGLDWVITSYLITLIGLVLFFGRLGDMYGHEKVYLSGLIFFIFTSILCSFSPSITSLIISRALQGIGAAMMISVSLGMVKKAFPSYELGKALGIYAVAIAAGLAIGPAIGGILIGFFGWRSIFLPNVPIGILSFIICMFVLERGIGEKVKWDIAGTLLQFTTLFLTILFLNRLEARSFDILEIFLILLIIISFSLFIWRELKAENPMIDLSLFKNYTFSAFSLALFFNYIGIYMVIFGLPFYLQKVMHYGPAITGLILTVSPMLMMIIAPFSGFLGDRIGSRPLAFLGSLISALAFYLMTWLTMFSSIYSVIGFLAILGMGAAIFQAPNNRAIMLSIPDDSAGVASSILVTMRNLGMIFAVSFASLLISTTISKTILESQVLYNLNSYNFTQGLHLVAILGIILSLSMALLSIWGSRRLKQVKPLLEEIISS